MKIENLVFLDAARDVRQAKAWRIRVASAAIHQSIERLKPHAEFPEIETAIAFLFDQVQRLETLSFLD